MSAGAFLRDKALHLAGGGFAVLFTAVLLTVIQAPRSAVGLLCAVELLGCLLPLGLEYVQKRRFYDGVLETLESLEEKYLLSAMLCPPRFAEGEILCQVTAGTGKSMNDAVAGARRDMAEYRTYIEGWIHEVKTPIAAVRLILENRPGPLAQRLEADLFQIEGYVEQALFYARSGAVERDYLVRAASLRELAAEAVKKYAGPLIAAGFSVELEGLDAVVYSDAKWVVFILGQLIANSIKYRGAAPRLIFSQRLEEAAAVLTVADNGIGISAADLPRIFDKGFTGGNGRSRAARSTGLGLYLCRRLCTRLGLGISAASAPGEGTAVALTFPKGRLHLAE